MNLLDKIIDHIRNRSYMSGVDRDKMRVKATGEVFTPTPLVQKILDQIPMEQFTDPSKTFLDPSCGDGQFLGEVLIRKIENGIDFETALASIYGVDLMIDNVDLCRERLLCGREDLRHIVEKNIQCRNALKYGYSFNPMCSSRKISEKKARNKQIRIREKIKKEQELKELEEKKQKLEKKLFGKSLLAEKC